MEMERRKFIRFEVPLRAHIAPSRRQKVVEEGVTRDFSREGLRIALKDLKLRRNTRVNLKIFMPGSQDAIPAKGKVMWSKAITGGGYETGVKIEEIAPKAKSEILDLAYDKWKKNMKNPL